MRYCKSLHHVYVFRKRKKSTKKTDVGKLVEYNKFKVKLGLAMFTKNDMLSWHCGVSNPRWPTFLGIHIKTSLISNYVVYFVILMRIIIRKMSALS